MKNALTPAELETSHATLQHIRLVGNLLHIVVVDILGRAQTHDESKLSSPELEAFTESTRLLADLEYGSPEYDAAKLKLGDALTHHYANNRHHPEHFENGIAGMTLVDLIEMVCDWIASSTRHKTGNVFTSLDINTKRFGIEPQLRQIIENTLKTMPGANRNAK